MSSNVKKWKRTNKRVMSLLNSSFEENTLNTDIDGDDHATLEVNSLNDSFVSTNEFMLSSSGSNSELNSESHSNSDGEPKTHHLMHWLVIPIVMYPKCIIHLKTTLQTWYSI